MPQIPSENTLRRLQRMLDWFEHAERGGLLPTLKEKAGIIPFEICRYELTEDASGSAGQKKAAAKLLKWGDSEAIEADTSVVFDVADGIGDDPGVTGDKGIAWKPHDRAEWETIVSFGAIIGVLAADLTYRTSTGANVTIKTGAPGSEVGTATVKGYDWLLASGKKIASGANVICVSVNGYHYVVAASTCPVDV